MRIISLQIVKKKHNNRLMTALITISELSDIFKLINKYSNTLLIY